MIKTLLFLLICHPLEYRQLTWADFKGKAPATRWNIAITTTYIDLTTEETDGVCTFRVTCTFCPEESWSRARDSATLRHEQGHFDLSEAFAREIRHDLQRYQGTGERAAAEALYDHMIQEWNQEQEDYDKKSDHGRDKAEQAWWENYIHEQLKKYEL
jgi:hypothetical protein